MVTQVTRLAKCSRCAKQSRTSVSLYNGKAYGPSCFIILMESVSWRAQQPEVKEQMCGCGHSFLAPDTISCVDRCCGCCKVQNPGYEHFICIKDS